MSVTEKVEIYFDLTATGGDFFTLDDPVKGKLDDATYVLGGDVAVDITPYVASYSIDRGRSRELDEIYAGSCVVTLHNYDSRFLPDQFLDIEPLLDEDGNPLLDENGEALYDESYVLPYGVGNVTPGKRITVTTAGIVIFDGLVSSWRTEYDSSLRAAATIIAEDALAALGRRRFNEWTTTAGQSPGARLTAVLDRPEVDWGVNRSIDEGVSTLQADLVTWGSNVLNYCQLVVKSDLGRLFADRRNVLTFRDRHNLVNPTIAARFADDGTGIDFRRATLQVGSDLLFTDVSVDREGGIAQTATSAAAREAYGIRRLDVPGLLLSTDEQSADMSDYLLGIYDEPQPRIDEVEVMLDALDEADQATVATLDLSSVVVARLTPQGQAQIIDKTFVVEGVSHRSDARSTHVVVQRLSPIASAESFVLDNSTLGVLDSGVLAF